MKRTSLGLLVLALLVPGPAQAALGGLTPVLSATGCLLRDPAGAGFPACSLIGGLVASPTRVALSPDGRFVYVSYRDGTAKLVAYARNAGTGELTQVPG